MKLLITGICGFVGKSLATELRQRMDAVDITGLDNLSRPGSELNRQALQKAGVKFFHGDIRNPSDLESLPRADWIIDASANPSVLAGVTGDTSSRQLIEHNLSGTTHLLEYCKRHHAGFLLLSTSRVYSAAALATLPLRTQGDVYIPEFQNCTMPGVSPAGVSEDFSNAPPLSLYGTGAILVLAYAFAMVAYRRRLH